MKKENAKKSVNVVVKKESELIMKQENVKNVEVKKVLLFGDELELKKLSNEELLNVIKKRFNKKELFEVGKMCYYILGLRKYKMIDLSYSSIVIIVKKLFEVNGLICNTSEKCLAWYNGRINKCLINIEEDFKNVGRIKVNNIDISNLDFKL